MPRPDDLYLDIETTFEGRISVIGFFSENLGLVQLVHPDVTALSLLNSMPEGGRLFTFNGHRFDLPYIVRELGVELAVRHETLDLMQMCKAHKIKGGQKSIEKKIGWKRETAGLSGRDAPGMWKAWWEDGDKEARDMLLKYNGEDVMGMVAIHRFLESYYLFDML
jgi:uncharacterized protein YprB with RNaseH-like and TPR domain